MNLAYKFLLHIYIFLWIPTTKVVWQGKWIAQHSSSECVAWSFQVTTFFFHPCTWKSDRHRRFLTLMWPNLAWGFAKKSGTDLLGSATCIFPAKCSAEIRVSWIFLKTREPAALLCSFIIVAYLEIFSQACLKSPLSTSYSPFLN